MLRSAAQTPNYNANPSGAIRKKGLLRKVCNFVRRVEISLNSKNHFVAILIGFGPT